jgi:hypothetical protein
VYGINESLFPVRTRAAHGELLNQEWLLNRAFARTPAWSLMCPSKDHQPEPAPVEALASEIASNSIRHGGGSGTLRLWSQDGALVRELRDTGVTTDPLAGRIPPPTGEPDAITPDASLLSRPRSGSAATGAAG